MKISALRCYTVPTPNKDYTIIVLETDTAIVGVGEATLDKRSMAVTAAIREGFRYLRGKDPLTIERHWASMNDLVYWGDGAIGRAALAGLDQALWDIAGKAAGLPVHRLCGGAVTDKIPVYVNQWYRGAKSTGELIEKAHAAVARGRTALKWYPFGTEPEFEYRPRSHNVDAAIDEVRQMREALGPDVSLMVDIWRRLDWSSAARFCRGIEPYNLMFVEEPTEYQSAEAYLRLAAATGARIAAGERFHSRRPFAELAQKQALGLMQPSIIRVGGMTEIRKIGNLAETYSIGIAFHNPHGPVATAAAIQIAAVLSNFVILETYEDDVPAMRGEMVAEGPKLVGDHFVVPNTPGLGVIVDEDRLKSLARDSYVLTSDSVM